MYTLKVKTLVRKSHRTEVAMLETMLGTKVYMVFYLIKFSFISMQACITSCVHCPYIKLQFYKVKQDRPRYKQDNTVMHSITFRFR